MAPPTQFENLSPQLLVEVTRRQNAFLVKRKSHGNVSFSRDPMNLRNVPSFKNSGFLNTKAIGLNAGPNNTIVLTTKTPSKASNPAKSLHTVSYGASTPSRKLYASVVASTARKSYRADLRADAVARASALKHTARPVKERKNVHKVRGSKKNRAAAAAAVHEA